MCPWAARLAGFVFSRLGQVQWLTSGTPLVWTPNQVAISAGLADGYAKRAFFAGRNLATSPYYHFPIWRAGTVWTKSLWQMSGGRIAFPLSQAGDFELWTRFWEHADLYTMNIPIAGRQIAAGDMESGIYWRAAAKHLEEHAIPTPPSKFALRAQGQLVRRFPALQERLSQLAPHIWISPATLECGVSSHFIL
jgi:hypothetical protein